MCNWKCFLQRVFPFQQRVILSILCFLGIINANTMRNCLSIVIVDMVKNLHFNETEFQNGNFCPIPNRQNNNTTMNRNGEYEWTEEFQGIILSSFYWGYIILHIPGGMLSQKFGGKFLFAFGILSTAILTLLTPFAVDKGGGNALIAIRFFQGLGEGIVFPALTTMLAIWIPLSERSMLGSIVFGAGQIGIILGTVLSGIIIDYYNNWRLVFYFFGIMGIIWVLFFILLCYNDPESHPYITEKEKNFLQKEIGKLKVNNNFKAIPWKLIFTNIPVLVMFFAQISDFGFHVMVIDLPKYMSDVLHFDIEENGIYSSVPYMMMWIVSIGAGFMGDWLIKKKHLSVTNSRKLFTTLASTGPAIFIIAASYAGCNRVTVVILFTIAMGLMGTFYAGMRLNCLDLSPNYAGILMAITNSISSATGTIAPYIVGTLTANKSLFEWRLVFWYAFAVFLITNIIYLMWASSDIQPFDSCSTVTHNYECNRIISQEDNITQKTTDNR